MDQNYDCDVRLDKHGHPDVEYYIGEAKRLRAEAVSQLFHEIAEWLKMHLGKQPALPLRPSV